MDFIAGHFDKFLLGGFVVYFSLLGLHGLHHGQMDSKFMDAMLDNNKLVLGALLGLIQGYRMGLRAADKNGNNPPPRPPAPPPEVKT